MTKIALILGAHAILAEFVDIGTGERIVPPGTFTPHDVDQRTRLIASGCISEDEVVDLSKKPVEELTRSELEHLAVESFKASMATASDDDLRLGLQSFRERQAKVSDSGAGGADGGDDDDDGLEAHGVTVADLREIAENEEVDLTGVSVKADIIAAIRQKRAGAPSTGE
ncbi:hypothetical protein FIM10_02120 [Sphingomonadales bacterium 56]|uniref:hypothetical protein n=1 Tax=Sphingobium sp. S6 TaxID=2758386 RepID=UPI001918AB4A|nr:hypothetical protein [Sphingobium sp. S6]MBY2927477.1 hypothetical protein [Sphingomonadales bacterium 56]CAD7335306.1 hypothetical protein SPHS6_00432 [Sphingobium sp. S6]